METFSIKGVFCPTKVPEPPAKGTSESGMEDGESGMEDGESGMEDGEGIKTKPPRGSNSVAANFLSGSTIDFQAHRGIMDGMESFGRISLFPGLVCPWHLLSFSDLDFNMFLGFG